jgi:hypothetical protein
VSKSLAFPPVAWVFPSMTVAFIAIAGLGFAVFERFWNLAIPFAVFSIAYVMLQVPSYERTFIPNTDAAAEFILWLAFAKLIYGVLFYTIVFATPANLEPIRPPIPDSATLCRPLRTSAQQSKTRAIRTLNLRVDGSIPSWLTTFTL